MAWTMPIPQNSVCPAYADSNVVIISHCSTLLGRTLGSNVLTMSDAEAAHSLMQLTLRS